jgi:hypothetical protein
MPRSCDDGSLRHQLEAKAADRKTRSFRRPERQNRHNGLIWIAAPIAYKQSAARIGSLAYERNSGSVFDNIDFEIFVAHAMNP